MKNLVLIFILLYSYSTVCLSDDNAPSMMEMLQGYAVDMPMEEQRDLEFPYTNWSSNFSNIAIFFSTNNSLNQRHHDESPSPGTQSFYTQRGVVSEAVVHYVYPHITNNSLLFNVYKKYEVFQSRTTLALYLAKKGFSRFAVIELQNAQKSLIELSQAIMALNTTRKIKSQLMLDTLKYTLRKTEHTLMPIINSLERYRLDEILSILTPEFLTHRSKWDIFKQIRARTMTFVVYSTLTFAILLEAIALGIIFSDDLVHRSMLIPHMVQEGSWLYVCGVGVAAVCYIRRGYELLKNGSIFTNLKALNNYQTPMCVDLLGEH